MHKKQGEKEETWTRNIFLLKVFCTISLLQWFPLLNLLSQDRLGAAYQKIDEPLKFFDELENQNLIHDGDTDYLKTLLEHVSRNDLIEQVENYERERKVVVRQVFRNPSLLEGPFFGRKEIMDRWGSSDEYRYGSFKCEAVDRFRTYLCPVHICLFFFFKIFVSN